jgi:hypothetical protein
MIAYYEARAAAHAASRDAELRLSTRISRLRLATFLPGAAWLAWSLSRRAEPLVIIPGVVLLLAFAVLVVWHARVEERAAWFDALHVANLHAIARIAREWDRLPPADPPPGVEHHPYAIDLDLFGHASLMQWLGPAATAPGTHTMHLWLLHPGEPDQVAARQQAVRELAPALDWREQLAGHGQMTAGVRPAELDTFLKWAEGPAPFTPSGTRLLRAGTLVLTASIWLLIGLHASGALDAALWLIPILAGMVLSFATAPRVHGHFNRAGAGQHAFARYAGLVAHAAAAPAAAPALRSIHERFSVSGSSAPQCMRSLNRIIGFAQLRTGAAIFHFPIQALTLWDFHVFFALDSWRRRVGGHVRDWLEAMGELDALSAFAQISADNPEWCLPSIAASPTLKDRKYVAEGLGHPLIPAGRRVGNDVTVGPPGTLLLITGSNMSGKSTLLRAIGLNAVLAQAGAPVCATSLRMPPVDLESSIRVQDSLEHGLSYFMAALARLKGVVERSRHAAPDRLVMYLLDEILQGTNTAERGIAVRGIARHLLESGAVGVMTTHDLAIAGEEPLKSSAQLAHFTETVDERGKMSFDYRLRPGLATSRNALRLMHLIGIELSVDS